MQQCALWEYDRDSNKTCWSLTLYWLCLRELWYIIHPGWHPRGHWIDYASEGYDFSSTQGSVQHTRCSSVRCESMTGIAIKHVGHWHCTDYASESYDISSTQGDTALTMPPRVMIFPQPKEAYSVCCVHCRCSSLRCESMTGVATMPLRVRIYHSPKEALNWLCLRGLWFFLYPRKRTAHSRCSSLRCESMTGLAIKPD